LDVGTFWRYRRVSEYASEGYEGSCDDTAIVRILRTVSHDGRICPCFSWNPQVGHTAFVFHGNGPVFVMMAGDTAIAEGDSMGWKRHASYPWRLFDEQAGLW
jgi:hypothetical protein